MSFSQQFREISQIGIYKVSFPHISDMDCQIKICPTRSDPYFGSDPPQFLCLTNFCHKKTGSGYECYRRKVQLPEEEGFI